MSLGEFTSAIIMNDAGDTLAASPGCASMPEDDRKGLASLWKNTASAKKNGLTLLGDQYMCKTNNDGNLVGAGVCFPYSLRSYRGEDDTGVTT